MYKPFNHFLLRIPTKPFVLLENKLSNLIEEKQFQQAIYIASPVLYQELMKMIKGDISNAKEKQSIEYSLNRYAHRMSTRCTPFGLFSGCATGVIGDMTSINIGDDIITSTRLDMSYLCTLSQMIQSDSEVINKMIYYPNTTIYQVGRKYRYIEFQYLDSKRVHRASALDASIYLKDILKMAKKGVTKGKILSYLLNKEVPYEEAIAYINGLIESQFIVGELSPFVTGEDYLQYIIRTLHRLSVNSSFVATIKEIKKALNALDAPKSEALELYQNVITLINGMGLSYDENKLFQVDIIRKTSQVTIGKDVIKELSKVIGFLNKITLERAGNQILIDFQNKFYERYGDQEISLMEALDPEMGLGYPLGSGAKYSTPLLDNLIFLNAASKSNGYPTSAFDSKLLKKMIACVASGAKEIVLTDADVNTMKENWENVSPTAFAMFEIVRADKEGLLINLKSLSGTCAANLMARFSHTDSQISDMVRQIANKEQQLMPDVILAEIAHIPDSRVGNILSRPHIRDYEILYLANSNLSPESCIYVSDLLLSVKNGKMVLRSKQFDKGIVPRLTTAHNYQHHSMPIYRFLCDMQLQQQRGNFSFQWEGLGAGFDFLPRVRYSNTILSLATWRVRVEDIKHLFTLESENLINAAKKWRSGISLDQYTLLVDGDNTLFIDWENAVSMQSMFTIVKKKKIVIFSEFIFEPEYAVVKDKHGNPYLNECIVAFYKDGK